MTDLTTFTTRSTRAGAKTRAWQRYLGEVYYRLDVRACDTDIRGTMTKRRIGAFGLSRLAVSENKVRRTRQSIASDQVEEFCFVFVLAGHTVHRHREVEAVASRGDVFFVNASEPFEVHHSDGTDLICLTVPCDDLRLRIPAIDDSALRMGVPNGLVGKALMQLIGGALSHGIQADACGMEAICLEMLDLTLQARAGRPPRS